MTVARHGNGIMGMRRRLVTLSRALIELIENDSWNAPAKEKLILFVCIVLHPWRYLLSGKNLLIKHSHHVPLFRRSFLIISD
jgi:hypothetical protein